MQDNQTPKNIEVRGDLKIKLIVISLLVLGLLLFPPLSILAPVPFALAYLVLGRFGGLTFAGVMSLVLTLLAIKLPGYVNPIATLTFVLAMIGILLAETIMRRVHPIKGFISIGILLNLLSALVIGFAILATDFSPKKIIEEAATKFIAELKTSEKLSVLDAEEGEEARALKDLVNNPKDLVDKFLTWLPAGFFLTIFLTCWICFYVILRNSLFWRQKIKYPFGLRDFFRFKAPEYLVYPLILALALTLGGKFFIGNLGEVIGGNLLYCLGIFYFFHGLGIFVDLLDYLKVYGILRALMFLLTFLFIWRVLVIVGVFDLWVNFRRFFNRTNLNK